MVYADKEAVVIGVLDNAVYKLGIVLARLARQNIFNAVDIPSAS